jgi:hypothetical protein
MQPSGQQTTVQPRPHTPPTFLRVFWLCYNCATALVGCLWGIVALLHHAISAGLLLLLCVGWPFVYAISQGRGDRSLWVSTDRVPESLIRVLRDRPDRWDYSPGVVRPVLWTIGNLLLGAILLLSCIFIVREGDLLDIVGGIFFAIPAIQLIIAALRGRAWMNVIIWRIYSRDGT